MTDKCQSKDCQKAAVAVPKILIQPQGWPKGTASPLACIISLKLCRKHLRGLDVQELMSDDFREMAKASVRDKCPPNFETAMIRAVDLSSNEYAEFERMMHKAQGKTEQ